MVEKSIGYISSKTLREIYNQRAIKKSKCVICSAHESLCHTHHVLPLSYLSLYIEGCFNVYANAVEALTEKDFSDTVAVWEFLPPKWRYTFLCPTCHVIMHRIIEAKGIRSAYQLLTMKGIQSSMRVAFELVPDEIRREKFLSLSSLFDSNALIFMKFIDKMGWVDLDTLAGVEELKTELLDTLANLEDC